MGQLDGAERTRLSRHRNTGRRCIHVHALAGLHCFLDNRRICLANDTAERALRCIALGRKFRLFAASDRGGRCWAAA